MEEELLILGLSVALIPWALWIGRSSGSSWRETLGLTTGVFLGGHTISLLIALAFRTSFAGVGFLIMFGFCVVSHFGTSSERAMRKSDRQRDDYLRRHNEKDPLNEQAETERDPRSPIVEGPKSNGGVDRRGLPLSVVIGIRDSSDVKIVRARRLWTCSICEGTVEIGQQYLRARTSRGSAELSICSDCEERYRLMELPSLTGRLP